MRPPILKLPTLSGYPRPSISQLPTLQPPSIEFPQTVTKPRTTKLQPQGAKLDENEERSSTILPAEAPEVNEIEGHTLSTKVAPSEAPQSQFIAMTFIPVAAVCILLLIFGAGTWFLRNRFCGSRKSKEDTVSLFLSIGLSFFNWEINPHLYPVILSPFPLFFTFLRLWFSFVACFFFHFFFLDHISSKVKNDFITVFLIWIMKFLCFPKVYYIAFILVHEGLLRIG